MTVKNKLYMGNRLTETYFTYTDTFQTSIHQDNLGTHSKTEK